MKNALRRDDEAKRVCEEWTEMRIGTRRDRMKGETR